MSKPDQGAALHSLRIQAELLNDCTAARLTVAGSALTVIGRILHRNVTSCDLPLKPMDVEGLSYAVEALGDYVNELCGDLENTSGFMLSKLKELGVKL